MNQDKYDMEKIGVAFGRFQPFHNGHLEYIKLAKSTCKKLVVGITNPDPIHIKEVGVDTSRSLPSSNPFTYYDRMMMLKLSLLENDFSYAEFEIVPFPINFPELLRYYIPNGALINIALLEEWGKTKIKLIESVNLRVHIVDLKKKLTTATLIREKIKANESYKHLVPNAVWEYIKENKLEDKVINEVH